MNQTKDQIETRIDHARMELNANLHELETRAVSAMDWKQHFDTNPGTLLAAAFVGGIALSLFLGPGRRARRAPQGESEMWSRVKGALIGLAAARITDYVGHIIPAASPQIPKESR